MHMQEWAAQEVKQLSLLIRALNFGVGKQQYTWMEFPPLLLQDGDTLQTGVCVLAASGSNKGRLYFQPGSILYNSSCRGRCLWPCVDVCWECSCFSTRLRQTSSHSPQASCTLFQAD